MKTQKTLKALILTLAMVIVMLLPATMNAQDGMDGFFRSGNESYENRDGGYNLDNQTFGQEVVPVGNGLIIMLAAGGAYALKCRKNKTLIKNEKA